MTVNQIGSQSSYLQVIRAQNAFQNIKARQEQEKTSEKEIETFKIFSKNAEVEKPSLNNGISQAQNRFIGEVKNFAAKYNLNNIEEDDIKYAIKYGTSLLADYKA
jgi:hypothetical protein